LFKLYDDFCGSFNFHIEFVAIIRSIIYNKGMQLNADIREQQKELAKAQVEIARGFVETRLADVPEIRSVLLSGSVARGTFMPGKYGGATEFESSHMTRAITKDVKKSLKKNSCNS
jgi:hypothetical protein